VTVESHKNRCQLHKLVCHAARDTLKNVTEEVRFISVVLWNSCVKCYIVFLKTL